MIKEIGKILSLKVLNTIVGAVGFGLLAYFTVRSDFEIPYRIGGIFSGICLITLTFMIRKSLALAQNKFFSSGSNIVFSGSFIDSTYSLIIFMFCPMFVIISSKGENFLSLAIFMLVVLMSAVVKKSAAINSSMVMFCFFVLCIAFEHWYQSLSPSIALFSLFISRQGIISKEASSSKNLINYFIEESFYKKSRWAMLPNIEIQGDHIAEKFWLTAEKTKVSISGDRKTITLSTQEIIAEDTSITIEFFETYFGANGIDLADVRLQRLGNLTRIILRFNSEIYTASSLGSDVAIANSLNTYEKKIKSSKVLMNANLTDCLKSFDENLQRTDDRSINSDLIYCQKLYEYCITRISNHQRTFFFYAPNLAIQEILFYCNGKLFPLSLKHTSIEETGRPIDGVFRSQGQVEIDIKAGHEAISELVEVMFRVDKTLRANQFQQAEKFALKFMQTKT